MAAELRKSPTLQITDEITNALADEKLSQKYGTSIPVNMGRKYQKHIEQKYAQLKAEFNSINKDPSDGITIEELSEFLGSRNNKKYTKDGIEEIFDLLDRNRDNEITVEEFVKSYIILEEKMRVKSIRLKKQLSDLENLKRKYDRNILEHNKEVIGPSEISKKGFVKVGLWEGKNLTGYDGSDNCESYGIVSLDDQTEVSKVISETADPIWNEDFTFNPKGKSSMIRIQIMDKQTDVMYGQISMPLIQFQNQEKVDKYYPIEDKDGNETEALLRLKIHFVWSQKKYFIDRKAKTELFQESTRKSLEELQTYEKLYEKPFGILLYAEVSNILEKGLHEREDEGAEFLENSKRRSVNLSPRTSTASRLVSHFEKVVEGAVGSQLKWSQMTNFLTLTNLILTLLCFFDRGDFPSLSISFFLYGLYIFNKKRKEILKQLTLVIFFIAATVVFDSVWLTIQYKAYWTGIDSMRPSYWFKSVVYGVTVLNVVIKLSIAASLWAMKLRAIKKKKKRATN